MPGRCEDALKCLFCSISVRSKKWQHNIMSLRLVKSQFILFTVGREDVQVFLKTWGMITLVAFWLLLTNWKVRNNDWMFHYIGGYALASPLVNLHKMFNWGFTGQFMSLGSSVCKHAVFMWSFTGNSITDAHSRSRALICFNVVIKAKAEHLQLNALIRLHALQLFPNTYNWDGKHVYRKEYNCLS